MLAYVIIKMKVISEKRTVNRVIAALYVTMTSAIFIAYLSEVLKHNRTLGYLITLGVVMLIPELVNYFFQTKYPEGDVTKYILTIGYFIMYCIVLLTTYTPSVFTYIMPLLLVLILTHDYKFLITINVCTFIVNVLYAIYNMGFTKNAEDLVFVVNVKIQMVIITIFCVFVFVVARIDARINKQKLREIKTKNDENLKMIDKMLETVRQIEEIVLGINGDVKSLEDSCNMTVSAMSEVSEGTSQTAENIQKQLEMTESIQSEIEDTKELAHTFNKVSMDAGKYIHDGVSNINNLIQSVEKNNCHSRDTIENIRKLEERVKKIDEIIGLIEQISTQTNLLSLNASIEAARAGDAGKGFSVVATEIRNLAEMTAASVKEIQNMVKDINNNTNRVSDSINVFVDGFQEQNKMILDTESNFKGISSKVQVIEEKANLLKGRVDSLNHSNKTIVEAIQNISAISQQTIANSIQTEELSGKNLTYAKDIKSISEQLHRVSNSLRVEG
ncbi:methyl-accepting chemotaxis protein [Anaeromicropila populeti]|uniref:Methyl-accepting chemotaxis protein n=1 Tax=Anaeromicropila populeti TaxID=37658 RepID=A0A1I6IKH5_9FIRM|nr:methyl-accepting chemotaxis protein [Anaeromicropila populeti]SFR67222.1 Methyl-accepting chemotaxis protein [Anaeromicropila populeti]